MSFTRTRLPGFWTFGSAVLPGEFEHIDDYAYAIDGKGGDLRADGFDHHRRALASRYRDRLSRATRTPSTSMAR